MEPTSAHSAPAAPRGLGYASGETPVDADPVIPDSWLEDHAGLVIVGGMVLSGLVATAILQGLYLLAAGLVRLLA